MPATEAGLVEGMKKELVASGAYVNKNHGGPNSRGRPDLEGGYRGLHFGIEAKLPGKEKNVTKLQKSQLRAIQKAGGIGVVLSSRAGVRELIIKMDRRADRLGMPRVT